MLFDKTNDRKYLLGFDLRDDYSQISYMNLSDNPSREPETFSLVEGQENYNIPTALCKQKGRNKWFCGMEAARMSADEDVTYIANLLTLALSEETVTVEENEYESAALLALFVKRTLKLMDSRIPMDQIAAVMFTCRTMDRKMIELLENVRKRLDLSCDIWYEGYGSSYYNFMLMQDDSLREPASILFEYDRGRKMMVYRLIFNKLTTPCVGYRQEHEYPEPEGKTQKERDHAFYQIAEKELSGGPHFSSAFLIGNGFSDDWMNKSLQYICRGRRTFMGSNLYSKGAAYGAYIKVRKPAAAQNYFFLDSNKLNTNIGINAVRFGQSSLHSLLDAGTNWYEVDQTEDLILEDGNDLHLILKPLTQGQAEDYLIRLDDLPMREGRTTRIRLHFTMTAPDKVHLLITDLGFGEIFPSSGLKWEQTITLGQ